MAEYLKVTIADNNDAVEETLIVGNKSSREVAKHLRFYFETYDTVEEWEEEQELEDEEDDEDEEEDDE